LNTTTVTVQSQTKYINPTKHIFGEKESEFHMSFVLSSELLKKFKLILKNKLECKCHRQD